MCDLRQGNIGAFRIQQRQLGKTLKILSIFTGNTKRRVVEAIIFIHRRDRRITDAVGHHIRNIGDTDPITGGRQTVCRHGDLRDPRLLEDRRFCRSRHLMQDIHDLLANPAQFLKVVSVNTQDERTMCTAHQITHVILNGLADTEINARHLCKSGPQTLDELCLVFP